ncbi:hypothetical protein BT96DRAFT_770885, partial [Gymnopus androsaceus JB14]
IPSWDGNTDVLMQWISKINDLAASSSSVFKQLGRAVPKRLEGSAEVWYWSLPLTYRTQIEANWGTLRQAIGDYYMNRKWYHNMRRKADKSHYRESGYENETPSEYFIRKNDLLTTVYNLDSSELIMNVMEGAPVNWATVLNTRQYNDIVEFQSAIHYYEDTLLELGDFM